MNLLGAAAASRAKSTGYATAPPVGNGSFLWNPNDKDAAVFLSDSDATATITPTTASVRGLTGKSSGRWFFEVTISGGTYAVVGVGDAIAAINSYPGSDLHSTGYFGLDGGKFGAGGTTGTAGAAYGAGDVITVDHNISAGTVAFYKNGLQQGTDSTLASGTTYYPMFGCGGAGADCIATINSTPLYPVPGSAQWG